MKFGVSFSVSSCLIAAAALLAQVSAQEQETVAVAERISVPSDLTPADDRIDLGNEEFIGDDQLAEKSQLTQQIFAQERDGGGHGHHGQHAQGKQHSTCSATSTSAPSSSYTSYSSSWSRMPLWTPVAQESYRAPQAALPQPSDPIPVPLPLPVKPGSIAIPGGPQYRPSFLPLPRPLLLLLLLLLRSPSLSKATRDQLSDTLK